MPNWKKVVVSGSAPTLSGLTVKGPLEVSMTASSGTIPLSIKAASDLSSDVLLQVRDDGNSYNLLTLDSEGALKIREAGNSGEGGGVYIQSGGTTSDHANMYINGGTARLSISSNTNGAFTVVPGGQSNGYLVGLTGKGTMALGQGATAGTKPSENNTNTLYIVNGTNPTNTPTDGFALFSKDVDSAAGTASPTFLTEDDTEIQLGSTSTLSGLKVTGTPEFSGLSTQGTETDVLTIDGSNIVGTRGLGSNAFTSTTIGTTTGNLAVDATTLQLNTGTIFNGSATRNISAVTAAITEAGTGLATSAQIYTFVTGLGYGSGTVQSVGTNTGLSGTVTTSGNLSLALGDLADMTQTWDNDVDEFIVLDGGTQKRKLSSEIFGTNAFNSTSFLTSLSGAVLTTTTQTVGGVKTFSDQIKISDGTEGSPALVFANNNTTGFFRASGNANLSVSIGGSRVTRYDATHITLDQELKLSDLNASTVDTDKFLVAASDGDVEYRTGAEVLSDIGALSSVSLTSNVTGTLPVANGGTGVTSLDAIALSEFDNDLSTMNLTGNQSASGTKTFTGQIVIGANGSTSAPMIRFPGTSTNTGFYASNPDEISITQGGAQAFKFDSNGFQSLLSGTSQFTGHLQAHCLGIGGTPSTTSGEIWAYGDIVANKSSDRRLKKYIKNIPNALEKVSQINGVTFEWKKTDEKMKKEVHSHEGHDVGVIAQEVEEVLPEIVATRDNGYKAVYYEKLVPLLIEAVKELKAEVDELKKSK